MADAACRQLGYPYQLSYQSTNTSSFSGIAITSQSCASSNNGLFDCVTGGIDFCVLTSMLTCDGKFQLIISRLTVASCMAKKVKTARLK